MKSILAGEILMMICAFCKNRSIVILLPVLYSKFCMMPFYALSFYFYFPFLHHRLDDRVLHILIHNCCENVIFRGPHICGAGPEI